MRLMGNDEMHVMFDMSMRTSIFLACAAPETLLTELITSNIDINHSSLISHQESIPAEYNYNISRGGLEAEI